MHPSRSAQPPTALLVWALAAVAALNVHASPPDGPPHFHAARANLEQPDLAAVPLMHRATPTNLQAFSGALAGAAAPPITQSTDVDRPFEVDGDTFTDYASAADRACDNQHNACADAVNSKKTAGLSVSDCDTQNTQCKSAATSATQTAFTTLASSNSEFDFFCDL